MPCHTPRFQTHAASETAIPITSTIVPVALGETVWSPRASVVAVPVETNTPWARPNGKPVMVPSTRRAATRIAHGASDARDTAAGPVHPGGGALERYPGAPPPCGEGDSCG